MSLIVVGTDGSDTANIALAEAAKLASLEGGRLAILSAYKPLKADVGDAHGNRETAAWEDGLSRSIVDEILNEAAISARSQGATVETHSFKGDPADALIDFAEKENADLIVVGNKGMQSSRRFLLGSVPNKITHHAPCSVLVVRTT